MDELEFRRLLELFPIVRSRDYIFQTDLESSRQSTARSAQNEQKEWQDAWNEGSSKEATIQESGQQDAFWEKLKLAAEKKVGKAEAEKFCKAFQQVHRKLVYEELSLDAAQSFISSSKSFGE